MALTVTDTTGHYCFANVPAGPYSLVAHMPECPGQLQCASQMVRVQIVTAQAQRVDVALQCAMARPHTLYLPLIEEDMPPR